MAASVVYTGLQREIASAQRLRRLVSRTAAIA